MHPPRLAGLLFGLGLFAVLAPSPGRTDDLDLQVPETPAGFALDVGFPTPDAATAGAIDVPAVPETVVLVPPPEPSAAATTASAAPTASAAAQASAAPQAFAPALDLPAPAEASASIPEVEALAGAIEVRLADPKLPLPPKLSRRDREALAAAYAANRFRPLWIADGAWTHPAEAVASRLGRADEDGLDPVDYPVPRLKGGLAQPAPADLAEADLKLSALAFLYARDARGGRVEPGRISGLVTPKLVLPTVEAVLSALRSASDPDTALQSFNPVHPGYKALRAKLAELRETRPAGPMVRNGARAGGPMLASTDGDIPAEGRGLRAASPRLEGDIVANMERWRWLPVEVAPRSIMVNVPEFRLRVMQNGRVAHETRVITGNPKTPTPIFSGLMEYAIVNPSWFIPPSILKKEILPGLAKDPTYAARRGYEVVRRGNAVSVRQPPGAGNALGYIKFMFPNDHAVYLHDTPNRGLFGSAQRAFSHGCVRVEQPFALGGEIIGGGWTEARLKSLIGRGERTIFLAEKLPVNLTYFTVSIDEYGSVRTFDDLYGYHRRVRMALGLGA